MPSLTDVKAFVSQLSNKQLIQLQKKLQKKKKKQNSSHFGPAAARMVAPTPQSSALERVSPVKEQQTLRQRFAPYAKYFGIVDKGRGQVPLGELRKKDAKAAEAYEQGVSLDIFLAGLGMDDVATEEDLFPELPAVPMTPAKTPAKAPSKVEAARAKAKQGTPAEFKSPFEMAMHNAAKSSRKKGADEMEAAKTTGGYSHSYIRKRK